jgi:hypothetical protein
MGILESLASGLRQAGGVVSPVVGSELAKEDHENAILKRQEELQQLNQRMHDEREQALSGIVAPHLAKGDFEGAAKAAAASGVPGSTKLSLDLMNKIDERKARAEQAKQARDNQALQIALSFDAKQSALDQQKELALSRAADQKERDAVNAQFKQRDLELRERNAAVMEGLKQQGLDIQRIQADAKKEKEVGQGVQQLSKALEKANLPEADATLGAVESALGKTPELAEFISGAYAKVPDIAIRAVPGIDAAKADEIRAGRQAFNKLFNITLKNRSGSAVTNQELDRLKQEFATGMFKTPKQLADAVAQARNIIQKHYASVSAGYGADVLNAYNKNVKDMGGRIVLEPSASNANSDIDALIDKYTK